MWILRLWIIFSVIVATCITMSDPDGQYLLMNYSLAILGYYTLSKIVVFLITSIPLYCLVMAGLISFKKAGKFLIK